MELRSITRRPHRYRDEDDEIDEYLPPKPVFVLPTIPYDPTLPPAAFPTIPLDAYPQKDTKDSDSCDKSEEEPLQLVHRPAKEMEKGLGVRWEAVGEPGNFNTLFEHVDEDESRAPVLKGHPVDGGEPFEEEYYGWVPREVKNAEGRTEVRGFLDAYEARGVQWIDLSNGMKLIIFRELTKIMSLRRISDLLDLSSEDNEAFAELYGRELELREKTDAILERIRHRQLALLMSSPQSTAEDCDAIWEEEHRGASLEQPSTFSISKADIQLAKRFLYHLPVQENFKIGHKGRECFPPELQLMQVVLGVEGYEGTSTSFFDLDFVDLGEEDGFDDGNEPQGENNDYVVHNDAEDVVIVEPPASSFNQHSAVFSDFPRPPITHKTQQTNKRHLSRPVLTDTEDAEVAKAPRKGYFQEDSDYDADETSDTEDEDLPLALSYHASASSRENSKEKKGRGRPKSSGSCKKKQLSPRKKFASLDVIDENTDLKTPPYNLLPRQKKTRGPTKMVMFKVAPSKLKQVAFASSPSSSPGMPPGAFPTLPTPSTAHSSHTLNEPLKDPSVIPGRLSESARGKPAEAPQKVRTGNDASQTRTKPSPQVANSQLARPMSQAHAQGFESLNPPDLPSMGIPRTQYTSPPLPHSSQRPPSLPRSALHASNYVANNTQPRQQGAVSAPPVANSTGTQSNIRPESSYQHQPPISHSSPTAGPFSAVNHQFDNSDAANSRKHMTPDADVLEKQKANLQQPHHQNSRHYTGSPASIASVTAPSNRPSVQFDPATTIFPISEDRDQDAASHHHPQRGIFSGPTAPSPTPLTAAWNHVPRSRINSTPESAASRPSFNPRQKSEPVLSMGQQPVSVSLAPSTVFDHSVDGQVLNEPGRHAHCSGMNLNDHHQQQTPNSTQTHIPDDIYLTTSAGTNQYPSLAHPHLFGLAQARLQAETMVQNSDAYMRSLPGAYNSASTPPFASASANTNNDMSQLPANALMTGLGVSFEGANLEHQQHRQMPFEPSSSTFASSQMENNLDQLNFYTSRHERTTNVPPEQNWSTLHPQNYTFTSATPENLRPSINTSQGIGQGFNTSLYSRQQTSQATNLSNSDIRNTTEVVDLERAVSPTNASSNNKRQTFAPTIKYEKTSPSKASVGKLQHNTTQTSAPTGTLPMFQRSFHASSSGPNVFGASDFGSNSPSTAENYAIAASEPKTQATIIATVETSSTMPRPSSATISALKPQVSTHAEGEPNSEAVDTSDMPYAAGHGITLNTSQSSPRSESISKPQPSVPTPITSSSFSQKSATEAAKYTPARQFSPNIPSMDLSHAHSTNSATASRSMYAQPQQQAKSWVPERISSVNAPVDTETASSSTQEPPKPNFTAKPRPRSALSDTAIASSSTHQRPMVTAKPDFEKAAHDTKAANPPAVPKATRAPPVAKDSKVNKPEAAPQTSKASTNNAPPDSKPANPRPAPKTTRKPPATQKAATNPAISQPSVEIPAKAAPLPAPKPAKGRASSNYSNIPATVAPKRAPDKRATPVPNKPERKPSKSAAAQAAGYVMLGEVEDLEAQKRLNAPPPILQERSRSEARAVKEAHEKGIQEEMKREKGVGNGGLSVVVKSGVGAKRKLEDIDEEVEEKVKKVVKRAKKGHEDGGSVAAGGKKLGGKRAREEVEEEEGIEVVERKAGRFVKKAKK